MIYITGSSGYIGKAFVKKLESENSSFLPIHRDSNNRLIFPAGENLSNVSERVFVHLAARVHENGEQDFSYYLKDNCDLLIEAWNLSRLLNCNKFLFMSTISVYDSFKDKEITLESLPSPLTAYGISKHEAEKYLSSIDLPENVRIDILRIPVVVGPDAKGNIGKLQKLIRSRIPMPFGALNEARSYLDLSYLCKYMYQLSSHKVQEYGKFIHLVSNDFNESTAQLVLRIAKSMSIRANLISVPLFILRFLAVLFDLFYKVFRIKLPFGRQELHKLNDKLIIRPGTKKII